MPINYYNTDYLVHPLMNLYTAHMFEDEKQNSFEKNAGYSFYDTPEEREAKKVAAQKAKDDYNTSNKLFGSDDYKKSGKLNLTKGEAWGLGTGILSSVSQGMGRNRQAREEEEMLARKRSNDYLPAMTKTYAYNTFSENPYNNSYFADGGEYGDDSYSDYEEMNTSNDESNQEDVTGGYSPFDTYHEDELAMSFISSLFDNEDDMMESFVFGNDDDDKEEEEAPSSYSGYKTSSSYTSTTEEGLPIQPLVEHLESLGLKPSSVKSGSHNRGSKHYSGQALDLGLNSTFGGDPQKMEAFIEYFNSELKNKFPNLKLRDERRRPAGQKEWHGSHLHLELI